MAIPTNGIDDIYDSMMRQEHDNQQEQLRRDERTSALQALQLPQERNSFAGAIVERYASFHGHVATMKALENTSIPGVFLDQTEDPWRRAVGLRQNLDARIAESFTDNYNNTVLTSIDALNIPNNRMLERLEQVRDSMVEQMRMTYAPAMQQAARMGTSVMVSTPTEVDPIMNSYYLRTMMQQASATTAGTRPNIIHIDDLEIGIDYTTEQHSLQEKEKPMPTIVTLKKTILLNNILRALNHAYHSEITYIYSNNVELHSSIELSKQYIQNSGYQSHDFTYISSSGDTRSIRLRLEFTEITQEILPENMQWSTTRIQNTTFGTHHLLEQIRNRYAFFDRPTSGLSNIIIDNYAPKLMYLTNLEQDQLRRNVILPKTIYTISPWFAQYFGATLVPTEQLCRILGYDIKDLKALITKVKRKDYTVTFVGYGGTVINTIHWLTELMKLTQSVNLFKTIEVFEPSNLEISNLLRFPKNPYIEHTVSNTSPACKLQLISSDELSLLSRTKPFLRQSRVDGEGDLYKTQIGTRYNTETRMYVAKPNHVFYGAPGIATRASFERIGHFVSATHNGNNAHLWLNPTQDADLQVESYGLIQLTPFFMNQLRLAIGFLEMLAETDLNLLEKDRLLLEYEFDGEAKLPTNRVYNFQLGNHDGTVTTEAQADVPF